MSVATEGKGGRQGDHGRPISKLSKLQKCQFQTSAILLFTDVPKLYGPEISQVLPCMLQFLDNLWRQFF